jgi:D-glycero-D-manno-heptose 1,7-bisphosphate phosphatase
MNPLTALKQATIKLVILDRDGVINKEREDYVRTVDQWIAIPGSLAAIAQLKQAGFLVTVATNQSGVARGYYSEQTLQAMHEKMAHQLKQNHNITLDGVAYCIHAPDAGCNDRKPNPGMLEHWLKKFQIPANQALMVGDAKRDLEAGLNAGTHVAGVHTGCGNKTIQENPEFCKTIPFFKDLAQLVDRLCNTP